MDIIIKNENNAIAKYNLNYEDVKNYLATELAKYKNLLVTEEFMQMAKKSRAELNSMKKDLKSRLSEIRQAQLAPYEALKTNYTDKLEQMIDEQLVRIDTAIKEIEKKKEQQKAEEIKAYFDEANKKAELEIPLNQVFNPKWTNATYSMNKVKVDIDNFFVSVTEDLKIIESFDDEFIIPLRKLYLSCFDMSAVMRNKVEFDREKQKRLEAEAEAERLRKELEQAKEENKSEILENLNGGYCVNASDNAEDNLTGIEEIPEANTPEDIQTLQETQSPLPREEKTEDEIPQFERIEFWVEVTPEQKLLMRNFVLENHIKCGKIVR
jgi:hypothetical protein